MDRQLRSILEETPAGRAYLAQIDATKKQRRARHAGSRREREGKREAKRDDRAIVRALVANRALGYCEACRTFHGDALQMDHFWGRAREESVQSCWMLCAECHRDKTENRPSRGAWLGGFSLHCEAMNYGEQFDKIDRAMALDAAQHPNRRTA